MSRDPQKWHPAWEASPLRKCYYRGASLDAAENLSITRTGPNGGTRRQLSREQIAGILETEVHQIDNLGVHFGQRYAASPVVWHEPAEAPSWQWGRIVPTTWPGGRAPAVRLADGSQLFDRFGPGFTLVDLSGRGTGAALVAAAVARGIPMVHLPVADAAVRACWERDLVLVRPDQHVAWRDDLAPADWDGVLDRVTGNATTRTRHVPADLAHQTLA